MAQDEKGGIVNDVQSTKKRERMMPDDQGKGKYT